MTQKSQSQFKQKKLKYNLGQDGHPLNCEHPRRLEGISRFGWQLQESTQVSASPRHSAAFERRFSSQTNFPHFQEEEYFDFFEANSIP